MRPSAGTGTKYAEQTQHSRDETGGEAYSSIWFLSDFTTKNYRHSISNDQRGQKMIETN